MTAEGILRIFPRRTEATPCDPLAFVGWPGLLRPPESSVREIHVSCVFTWDQQHCQRLGVAWKNQYPEARLRVGGPGFGDPEVLYLAIAQPKQKPISPLRYLQTKAQDEETVHKLRKRAGRMKDEDFQRQ